jgi:hypothetical protein
MTRFTKNANGSYNVNGHNYEMLTGSRAQVWHGTACKTSGGLKKTDLMQNKAGRIVSRAKHNTAKKDNRLVKAGYGTKKGKFGFVKLGVTKSASRGKSRRKSQKGGLSALSPAPFADGRDVGTSGADLQLNVTNRGGRRRKGGTSSKRGGKRRMKGGMHALSPSPFNGKGVGTSGNDVQYDSGNAG